MFAHPLVSLAYIITERRQLPLRLRIGDSGGVDRYDPSVYWLGLISGGIDTKPEFTNSPDLLHTNTVHNHTVR